MPNKIGKSEISRFNSLNPRKRFYLAVLLIFIGILTRTVFHIGENIEFVTAVSLVAGSFLGFYWAVFVPLIVLALSDFVIGNTLIFIFTWSAYAIIGIMGFLYLRKGKNPQSLLKVAKMGLFSSLFFYLWTNLGVWALDSFGMYSNDLGGLVDSYVMGLPFFKMNLIGNLVIVPLVFKIFHSVFLETKGILPERLSSISK